MQTKKTIVLGASMNPARESHLAVHRLQAMGHPVVAIGKTGGVIGSVEIETGQNLYTDIDTVSLYLNPQNQKDIYNYILLLHPQRIIFNPGSENGELAALALQNGIQTMEACTLVLLSTGQY